jgi:hypothetical protein
MAFDLDRAVRRVERQTGAALEITHDGAGVPYALIATDPELSERVLWRGARGRMFVRNLGTRSQWERNVKALHEEIYRERGSFKFKEQKGLCALC